MTKERQAECVRLLARAKRGDEGAHQQLVDIVVREYAGMVRRFYTSDPVMGREDIEFEFRWAIWRAVHKDDGRGDPIFYMAQYGQWAVKSLITAINRRRHGTSEPEGGVSVVSLDHDATYGEGGTWTEPVDESAESDPHGLVEISEEQGEAQERVLHILVKANLAPRHEEIIGMLLRGEVDLGEPLARKHIAEQLGVSGQRVTQLIAGIEKKMRAVDDSVFGKAGAPCDVLDWIGTVESAAEAEKPLLAQLAA